MSTLEKAYLKAMKISDDASDDKKRSVIVQATEKMPNFTKRDTKEILNSRVGISKMLQMESYSTEILKSKQLIYTGMEKSSTLERYRTLRTQLLSRSNKTNFITLVTSVEEKSNAQLIAANLATAFALDEAKTSMLIEADIRKASLNQLFELDDSKGVIDYLESEDMNCESVLYKTGIPRMRFVPSGLKRENSAEYFTTDKMQIFLSELLTRYPDRYPVINAPSLLESADTRILIELCDIVVLVVPYGKCTEEEIMQASLAIGEDKLAGVVLDGF